MLKITIPALPVSETEKVRADVIARYQRGEVTLEQGRVEIATVERAPDTNEVLAGILAALDADSERDREKKCRWAQDHHVGIPEGEIRAWFAANPNGSIKGGHYEYRTAEDYISYLRGRERRGNSIYAFPPANTDCALFASNLEISEPPASSMASERVIAAPLNADWGADIGGALSESQIAAARLETTADGKGNFPATIGSDGKIRWGWSQKSLAEAIGAHKWGTERGKPYNVKTIARWRDLPAYQAAVRRIGHLQMS